MSSAGLSVALHRVWWSEAAVAAHLTAMVERHATEGEVRHVALDIARWSADNAAAIRRVAGAHAIELSPYAEPQVPPGPWADLEAPALRLLEDLCQTYLLASSTSLAWEMLAQLAQAKRYGDVLELAARCHPQTLRQVRWANTMIKTAAPQALGAAV